MPTGRQGDPADDDRDDAIAALVGPGHGPGALQLEVTSRCNLSCRMCPLTTGDSSSSANPGALERPVSERLLASLGDVRHVYIAGFGEPLMSPGCLPLLETLDQRGVGITFVTNGQSLSRSVASRLARIERLVHVNVSIDTPDPVLYRELRGGSLERALKGLDNLVAAFADAGTDLGRLSVSAVLSRQSVATLAGFPADLAARGVPNLILQGLLDYTDFCGTSRPEPGSAVDGALAGIRDECERAGVNLHMSMPDRAPVEDSGDRGRVARVSTLRPAGPAPTRQCTLPWELPYVDSDGSVFPCCNAAAANRDALGTLRDDDLTSIWHGAEYRGFRRRLLEGTDLPESCRSCSAAPIGPHPLLAYRAEVVRASVDRELGRLSVAYRNLGREAWRRTDGILLGTADPRDGASEFAHADWLRSNRAGTFIEEVVPPGGIATFDIPIALSDRPAAGTLQLVKEGVMWMRGTELRLTSLHRRPRSLVPRGRARARSGWDVEVRWSDRPAGGRPGTSGTPSATPRRRPDLAGIRIRTVRPFRRERTGATAGR